MATTYYWGRPPSPKPPCSVAYRPMTGCGLQRDRKGSKSFKNFHFIQARQASTEPGLCLLDLRVLGLRHKPRQLDIPMRRLGLLACLRLFKHADRLNDSEVHASMKHDKRCARRTALKRKYADYICLQGSTARNCHQNLIHSSSVASRSSELHEMTSLFTSGWS